MKKLLLLTVFICIAIAMFAATPRVYMQKVTLTDGSMPGSPADANPIPGYNLSVFISTDPGVVYQTVGASNPANICLKRTGNGTTIPYYVVAYLNQSIFTVNWPIGATLDMTVTYIATGETAHWTKVVPAGTSAMLDTVDPILVGPYPPAGYTLLVESNYPGAEILFNGQPTGQITPYTFPAPAAAGNYSAFLPFVTWVVDPIVVPPLTQNASIRFVGVMTPDPAMTPVPADMAEIHIDWDAVAVPYMLTWMAPLSGPLPTGYTISWMGGAPIDLGNVISWTTPPIAEGAYEWLVTPYITDPAKGTRRALEAVKVNVSGNGDKGACTTAVLWHFTVVRDPYESPDGLVIIPNTPGLTFIIPPIPPIFPGINLPLGCYFFEGQTSGAKAMFPFVIAGPPASTWYVYSWYSAVMHPYPGNPVNGPYPFNGSIYVPALPPTPWTVILSTSPIMIPLPVELSSFTAVLTAEYFVNLTWVTESETQASGFNVYRSQDADYANAVRVNAALIPATNTSEQHTYNMLDTEVSTDNTYYYWLENVDMGGGSNLHGPQSVTVTGNPTPVLPEISVLNNAYPNPFRSGANTNISVSIKAGETGTVTVYNILGQNVKTFKVSEGNQILKWDGKGCGSGIYFYKLSTPTVNATKKLVIVR